MWRMGLAGGSKLRTVLKSNTVMTKYICLHKRLYNTFQLKTCAQLNENSLYSELGQWCKILRRKLR